jgi:hypothetical protein
MTPDYRVLPEGWLVYRVNDAFDVGKKPHEGHERRVTKECRAKSKAKTFL